MVPYAYDYFDTGKYSAHKYGNGKDGSYYTHRAGKHDRGTACHECGKIPVNQFYNQTEQ
jgi:hypothetical protein